jgi:Ni/Co efflux regulator RcnB
MRQLLVPGLVAAIAVPAAAACGPDASREQPNRAPDAHVLGPPRTDVLDQGGPLVLPSHYVAPVAGWRYRPLSAGERLRPAFYGPRYAIAEPARFRLPAAPAGRRWIRYGNDLVLVNTASGRVVRSVRNSFR